MASVARFGTRHSISVAIRNPKVSGPRSAIDRLGSAPLRDPSESERVADAPADDRPAEDVEAGRIDQALGAVRRALRLCSCRRRLRRQLGRARLHAGSHLDFDAIAAAGPSPCPPSSSAGAELFKAKFTTVDGAGRPKATQAIIPTKRKNGVNPPFSRTSGPDSNSCFGCHNDPINGGAATTSPMCSFRKASRARSSTTPTRHSRASGTRSR